MHALTSFLGLVALGATAAAQITSPLPRDDQKGRYLNFEVEPTAALAYSSIGPSLYALNIQGNRLVEMDPATMAIRAEIPIGLGAVCVVERPGTSEVWVVDRVQNCVSVVSRTTNSIVRTIRVGAEPQGMCFSPSGDRAWVTCSGLDRVDVIATSAYAVVQTIPVPFREPRGIAFSNGKVWVASFLSGNGSTGFGTAAAPLDVVGVGSTAGAPAGPLPDQDLVAITPGVVLGTDVLDPASTLTGLGTTLFNVHARPGKHQIWIPNTDALNTTHKGEGSFVAGQVVSNRITIVDTTGAQAPIVVDLDALAPAGTGCAQPTGLVFDPNIDRVYVCAFGSDQVVAFDIQPNQTLTWRGAVRLPPKQTYPRGTQPRTGAISPDGSTLFVFDRNDTSVARIALGSLPATIPFDVLNPLPHRIGFEAFSTEETLGRNLFADARHSKSKTSSCASCHVDGHTDGIVWDLSAYLDPESTPMAAVHFGLDVKGPLVTQSTRRMEESGPYHWRGEKRHINDFNKSFVSLLEREDAQGVTRDVGPDFQYLRHYINRLAWPANPHQRSDRSLTPDEYEGAQLFTTRPVVGTLTCSSCHTLPLGSRGEVVTMAADGVLDSADVPGLRGVAGKEGVSVNLGGGFGTRPALGAGLTHAGPYPTIEDVLLRNDPHASGVPQFGLTPLEAQKIAAFVRAFDTGLAPATTYQATAHAGNLATFAANELTYVLRQAQQHNCDVIVVRTPPTGATASFPRTGVYEPAFDQFRLCSASAAPMSAANLLAEAAGGRPVTFIGVPLGSGRSHGLDRDMDYVFDADEAATNTNPDLADTDNDAFPDGYELLYGENPLVVQTTVAGDTTPPHLAAPVRLVYATTNTLKIEFETDEPCRVLVTANGVPTQRVPLGYHHDHEHSVVINDLAPNTTYTIGLVMNDFAGNVYADTTTVFSTLSKALTEPARIGTFNLTVVPGTPAPVLGASVALRVGSQPAAAGYVLHTNVYRLAPSGQPELVAENTPIATDANGVANLRVRLPQTAPSTWYVVVTGVEAPAGAPPHVSAYDAKSFATVVY